jgi:pyroglutamyl-peptidase
MKLLVTAFGPFGGRSQNASSMALAGLKQRLPWLNTRILPVDSVIAPLRINQALRDLEPDAVVLLGEAGNSGAIRLETTAWNELEFRIPDNAGRKPQGKRVVEYAPDFLRSSLPFEAIHQELSSADHPVSMSEDPGRYLCNQILFHTLNALARSQPQVPAGFIHLPLEDVYPTALAVDALVRAIHVIRTGNTAVPSATRRVARSGVRGRRR